MEISIIVATDMNNAIGKDGKIPWSIKEDFKYFKETTTSHIVIMGKKTYLEMGKPLAFRENLVVSSTLKDDRVKIFTSLQKALDFCQKKEEFKNKKIFICGGASLYKEALPFAKYLYITKIKMEVKNADTFFPQVNMNEYKIIGCEVKKNLINYVLKRRFDENIFYESRL